MKKTYISPKARLINIDDQQLQANSPGNATVGTGGTDGNYAKRGDLGWFSDNEDEDDYDY